MPYASKIVLRAGNWTAEVLLNFVEKCLRDKVSWIAVVGDHCREIEDILDNLIVLDGADESRFIVTTSHPDETYDDVAAFLRNVDPSGDPQGVSL